MFSGINTIALFSGNIKWNGSQRWKFGKYPPLINNEQPAIKFSHIYNTGERKFVF